MRFSEDYFRGKYTISTMLRRPRRNRKSAAIRGFLSETHLSAERLIYPLFVSQKATSEIASMPGQKRLNQSDLLRQIEQSLGVGLRTFCLFPVVDDEWKDRTATYSHAEQNFYLHAIAAVKQRFPEAVVMTDVAMDPYSTDGHDGLVVDGQIVNDQTIEILVKMAIAQAAAGADIIGPSDMMDGRVGAIRQALDHAGHTGVSIMAYTAKYASAFYGPFRDALDSAPKFGDKKTYQMDPANRREALLEAQLDSEEGADFLMVKPALAYLDVIAALRSASELPIAAYNVSGEYAMLKAAAAKGWIDHDRAMVEMLLSIRRAGADAILTYFADEFVRLGGH